MQRAKFSAETVGSARLRPNAPMLKMLINDHLVLQHVTMPPAENLELLLWADDLDADREIDVSGTRSKQHCHG